MRGVAAQAKRGIALAFSHLTHYLTHPDMSPVRQILLACRLQIIQKQSFRSRPPTNKKSRGKKAVISSRFRLEFMIKRIANLEVPTRTLIALIYF